MPTKPKFSLYYLLALAPLALAAIAWPIINAPFESSDLGLFVLSALVVAAAAQLRIQLPKTESTLAFSDMSKIPLLCHELQYTTGPQGSEYYNQAVQPQSKAGRREAHTAS